MNAPTLIVGLGGKGSKVVLKVANMVTEEQRKHIGFAVMDTDVNELREIKAGNPFIHTIQTSTPQTVGEYLNQDEHASKTWFPVNPMLNPKVMTEGAGQVRAISRLAFDSVIRAGRMTELHTAIEDLYRLEPEEYQQALRVIIVSTLAGGTGSGLILPVALYIKNFLKTRFRQSGNITRGFFMLPEIFYGAVSGNTEKNNLNCNAYAALKEIDSFLMRGDGTLPKEYEKTARMEFPIPASSEYEEYDVTPYDFCFLYDGQNSDGKKLNSLEEYLDHAANCIYAQSIGPMNKRSNSSEDNTILKLCKEKGRNRYAGAGTSMLIYPIEDVKKYVALSWASEAISTQWIKYDNMYADRIKEIAEARRNGVFVPDLKLDKCYINSIEINSKDSAKDPFAKAIINACNEYEENSNIPTGNKWDNYVTALLNMIKSRTEPEGSLEKALEKASKKINATTANVVDKNDNRWQPFVDAYKDLVAAKSTADEYINETASTLAYTLFKGNVLEGKKEKYQLEKYIEGLENQYLHPNAIRYFLYKAQERMTRELNTQRTQLNDVIENFDLFEEQNFDISGTPEKEGVNDLEQRYPMTLLERLSSRPSSDQAKLTKKYREYYNWIKEYVSYSMHVEVLKEGLNYVNRLCGAIERLYKSFETKIDSINNEIVAIENKYSDSRGKTTRYVCASPECLKKMLEKMPYKGGVIDVDGELAKTIYIKIHEYANDATKSEDDSFFSSVFDKDIIDYFKGKLAKDYYDVVDIDVITAIEREAQYEFGKKGLDELRVYAEDVFDEAKILAAPFIEKPLGVEEEPIKACTFNNKLYDEKDDSPRMKLIRSNLLEFGGLMDEDISKYMILFYKSYYGLRANDLSKFAPPEKSPTTNRNAGEYFKSYYERVNRVHPKSEITRFITPHIDRWWHNVSMMPDIDDDNQLKLENEIFVSLFWGFMSGYVELFENRYGRVYKLNGDDLDIDEETSTLIVSNGSVCDNLYEVWDALSIYPELVKKIIKKKEAEINRELLANKSLKDSSLVKELNSFVVKGYPLNKGKGKENEVRSIFELPFLIKRSMPSDSYDDDKVIGLLNVEIKEVKNYISKFVTQKEYIDAVNKILTEQYEKFINNIEVEKELLNDIYHDRLFKRYMINIAKAFEELDLYDMAESIRDKQKELSK